MNKEMRERLKAAGFRVGDAEEFLGLTEEECHLVELRLAVSRAVRLKREKQGVTQQQLATRLKSSQSRVAKIEAGAVGVSLDLSFRALFAVGGGLADLAERKRVPKKVTKRVRPTTKTRKPAAKKPQEA
jgi:hypothetical protein